MMTVRPRRRGATRTCRLAASWAMALPLQVSAQMAPVSPAPAVRFEYDAEGRMTQQNNAPGTPGSTWLHHHDKLGRRIRTIDPLQGQTIFGHDAMDGLAQVIDPRGLSTSYGRDGFGQLIRLSSPDTGAAQMTYDAAGNPLSRQTPDGGITRFSHDALNRLLSTQHQHPNKPARQYQWFYDQTGAFFGTGIGRLTSISWPEVGPGGTAAIGGASFGYSPEGWLVLQQQRAEGTTALTVAYDRHVSGKVTGITYPSGVRVQLSHANGLPVSLHVAPNAAAGFAPLLTQITHRPFADEFSEMPGWVWNTAQGQQVHPRVYDTAGRMIGYRLGSLLRELQYDAADRIVGYQHRDVVTPMGIPPLQHVFSYDAIDRLQAGTFSDGVNFALGYDRNGNRSDWMKYRPIAPGSAQPTNNVASILQSGGFTISPSSNQLLGTSALPGSHRYDGQGNLSSVAGSSGPGPVLVHAADGRLASVTQAFNGPPTYYSYNNFGQRTRKVLPSGEQRLFVHGEQGELLGEYTATGAAVREYIWLGVTPVAVVQGGQIYPIHADHLGTPRVVLDTWGRQRWTWLADPFGETPPVTNPQSLGEFDLPLRHPGQYADAETGYWYNWHRYYDPMIGRYIQSDPIGLAGGINTYAYVMGNPLMYIDPNGLWALGDPLPQGLVDFGAGMGDVILFGQGRRLRDLLDVDGGIDPCSSEYGAGEWAGVGVSVATGFAGGLKAAGAKGAGKEFSHWIPNRVGGPRSVWNGNYVSTSTHALSDPYRYRFMPRNWKAQNPMPNAAIQQWVRIPNVYKGAAAGAAYGAGGAGLSGDCTCQR